ncbi:aggregation-promoting factor C-terminal-like domain-containing protein [Jiangella rhizosphaerae]|uniref:Lytic transglycosylase domain-containing protein n=1 Tax=Jiangella rhizosphaerae TaxID=2293569 RepID=A0A418KGP1_9ACTN|nr:lytic transglycosylase domain-containing protein [Jiangella rhizosphaerae]RIQ11192.1 lytic transglycosylase domain-containing protein [Jiangella rhizosphaerae]
MHRRRRRLRRVAAGLGILASITVLATLFTGWLVDSAGSGTAAVSTQRQLTLPEVPAKAEEPDRPSLERDLAAAAEAQVQAEAEAARAKAEAEAKAKAEAEAAAAAEAARQAAAEEAARSLERAIDDPQSAARTLMADYGWGDDQFQCLDNLWTRESNWRHTAENPSSGAYGIPQSLPPEKMSRFGDDYLTNPVTQIEWGLWYIEGRYGDPCGAWAHSEAVGWY